MKKTVPDTITKWAAGAFCVSPVGFGLSPNTGLTVFQPFFVSLTLPYSVIRGEVFTLKATVFNYLTKCIMVNIQVLFMHILAIHRNKNSDMHHIPKQYIYVLLFLNTYMWCVCLQVEVTLADSDQYTYRSCDGCHYRICLCGEESRTFSWIVTPTALGMNR